MKICFIADVIDRYNTGISQYSRHLLKYFKEIAPDNKYYVIHEKKSNDAIYSTTEEIIIPKLISQKLRAIVINLYLMFKRFDIVFNPSQLGPFIFPIPSPVVTTIHDVIPFKRPETRTWSDRMLHSVFLGRVLRNSSHFLADSYSTKKDIQEIFGVPSGKISVIHLAAPDLFKKQTNLQNFKKKYGIYYPYFLYVGTIEPRKNLYRILQGFEICKKRFPEFHFVIVGSFGWKYAPILNLVKQKLKGSVHFFKTVPNEDISFFYSGAAALVFPSLYEGFGLPILEAMACGCPVITARNSSLQEVAGDAALYADEFSYEDIASNMISLIPNKRLRLSLVTRGYERIKNFSWRKTARETLKVFQKITNK